MPKNKNIKIVIDTNLWISFLISKKFVALDNILFSDGITILFGEELIDEIRATIAKPKLSKYFTNPDKSLEEMLLAFNSYIKIIPVKSKVKICRDKEDNFLLALAKDGEADFLVTGDKNLLSIGEFEKIKIVTYAEYISG